MAANAGGKQHATAPRRGTTLLLGLGNDLLSDDAVGLRVAAALREPLAGQPEITISQSAEMGLALLDLVSGFERLVLVDAIQTGRAPPGYVHDLNGDELPGFSAISPHFVGIAEMLALGRELGMPMPTQIRIFAIEVQDPFTMATHLTPVLERALPGVTRDILAAVLGAA
jgi:hydrogenase maturation protease